jgi:Putative phage holin Dp-1
MSTTPVPDKKSQLVETAFFDTIKVVAILVLPLVGTLYFALAGALNLPDPEGVVGGIVAADTALGAFVKANEAKYNASDAKFDGVVNVIQTDAKKIYQLALNTDPNLIDQADKLLLKVVKPLPPPTPSVQWEATTPVIPTANVGSPVVQPSDMAQPQTPNPPNPAT